MHILKNRWFTKWVKKEGLTDSTLKNALIEIIPLSTGCLGSCTYCKTRHARGKLGSYDPNAIVERARSAIEEGVMEIWLTSEDTGAYGRDIDTDLPTLLKSIIKRTT